MKITLIGPGVMPIPPSGWGAIESLVWDYYQELSKLGHEVQVVNTYDRSSIVKQVDTFSPDFVHLQYDDLYDVLNHIKCPNKAVTAHYGYLQQPNRYGGYWNIMRGIINSSFHIFCLSEGIRQIYLSFGVDESRLFVTPNGAREDLFSFTETSKYPSRAIYLAKVTDRKKQYLYQEIDSLYFVGNLDDHRFDASSPRYLGEWSKDTLYSSLTDYSSLVLLSDGEADPLVTKEAMMSGLGLVISEYSTANLDLSLPFIDVIPTAKLDDISYVSSIIDKNMKMSAPIRRQIRKYATSTFSWSLIVKNYEKIIQGIKKGGLFGPP